MSMILSGCAGRPLAEREIVRAVLFSRQQEAYSVCLVLANQQDTPSGQAENKVISAQGHTPAQALQAAEQSLQGSAYYGLLDLAALPYDTTLDTAREIGTLLYENAQPAPELSVFLLDDRKIQSWAKQGSAVYHAMKAVGSNYKVHCGLQQLFAQEEICAIPVYTQGPGYGFALLPAEAAPVRCDGVAEAQLAAVLCGQSDRLQGVYAEGKAFVQARAQVTVDTDTIQLHLRDYDLKDLLNSGEDLQGMLAQELCAAFAVLQERMEEQGADPFHLQFWQACTYGPGSVMQSPRMEVLFE